MSSRDTLDETQIPGTNEVGVGFRIGLLHHVLFLDKIPGKISPKLLERFCKDVLEIGQ